MDSLSAKRKNRLTLFAGIDDEQVEKIINTAVYVVIDQGDFVYKQGEGPDYFYMVIDGQAELSVSLSDGEQISICHIGPGGHFGEASLLTQKGHCVNVRATTGMTLLRFEKEIFFTLLMPDCIFMERLCASLASRLLLSFDILADFFLRLNKEKKGPERNLDPSFFLEGEPVQELPKSTLRRQISAAIEQFKDHLEPLLITGEAGTGRRMVSQQIHYSSRVGEMTYREFDVRSMASDELEKELFCYNGEDSPFMLIDGFGLFDKPRGGTVVLYNAEYMTPELQNRLTVRLGEKWEDDNSGNDLVFTGCRLVLICTDRPEQQDGEEHLSPQLSSILRKNLFRVAPLRKHRRDIPRLIRYYLKRYCLQYGKAITQVEETTLGTFMNYNWPGNLTELASVVQRAVIIAKNNEPLSERMLVGIPRPEGKWEFNLLRFKFFRTIFTSRYFPVLPRIFVGIVLIFLVALLFFGPADPEKNIGLTLSWAIGWPVLVFGSFFFARLWCGICGLSVPGSIAQTLINPGQSTPPAIKGNSGWIVISLCIILFWVEIAWDAYSSPVLTASIISVITLGSLVFSIFFKRRVWCRFLCPLGGINAIFSMSSVLELRSNTHLCLNRCMDRLCFSGTDDNPGCPMFRHPFLVDNNRDCVLCGQCIKNCPYNSIHLNLRLAPQELWNQQVPRLEDSILVVCLGAILYPFAIHQSYPFLAEKLAAIIGNIPYSLPLAESLIFFSALLVCLTGYAILSAAIARLAGSNWKSTASVLGYGMIPLILGAFMAVHIEIFSSNFYLLVDNIRALFTQGVIHQPRSLFSSDAVFLLHLASVGGGLIASLYATRQIMTRLIKLRRHSFQAMTLQTLLLSFSAVIYIWIC